MSLRNGSSTFADALLPEIPESKWYDMLREEEFDLFILDIRDEILKRCEDNCYERYMDRQAVSFTIHCAYLAWVKVINIYNMPRDKGYEDLNMVKECWKMDKEPEPSKIDSWGTEVMTTSRDRVTVLEKESTQIQLAPTETIISETVSFMPSVYSSESSEYGEEVYEFECDFPGESVEYFVPKNESLFTRTLTMSREMLPLFEPFSLGLGKCREEIATPRRKPPDDVIQPAYIDVAAVPPNRYEVDYLVSESPQFKQSVRTDRKWPNK